MKKKDLIQKWLDYNLNEDELQAFKDLDAYSSLMQLDNAAKHYKAPAFNQEDAYKKLTSSLQTQRKSSSKMYWWAIASALVISLSVYVTTLQTNTVSRETAATEQQHFTLPDASQVTLLSNSSVSYDEENWSDKRDIALKGTAYFDVAKGKSFTVTSPNGVVTVLGTQFSIRDWGTYFEVVCYEGSVQVTQNSSTEVLTVGMSYTSIENSHTVDTETSPMPWSSKASTFKRVPLEHVIDLIERQYAVTVINEDEVKGSFTGTITHENLTDAIKTIALPFQLRFEVRNDTVILKKDF